MLNVFRLKMYSLLKCHLQCYIVSLLLSVVYAVPNAVPSHFSISHGQCVLLFSPVNGSLSKNSGFWFFRTIAGLVVAVPFQNVQRHC